MSVQGRPNAAGNRSRQKSCSASSVARADLVGGSGPAARGCARADRRHRSGGGRRRLPCTELGAAGEPAAPAPARPGSRHTAECLWAIAAGHRSIMPGAAGAGSGFGPEPGGAGYRGLPCRNSARPSGPPRPPRLGWRWPRCWSLASVLTAVVLHVRHPDALVTLLPSTDMRELHVDFDTFWHSAVALTHGADIYDTPAKLTNLNPPLLTVLLTPFAGLDALTAYRIFAGLTLLMVLGSVLAVARELRLRRCGHGGGAGRPCWPRRRCTARWCSARSTRCCWSGWSPAGSPSGAAGPVLAAVLYGITVALKPSLGPGAAAARPSSGAGCRCAPGSRRRRGRRCSGCWSPARRAARVAARSRFSEPVPDTVDNASLPGLAVRFGLPAVIGHAARGRGAGRHPGLVRPPPGPHRPGRHRAVRGARRRAALLPDLLAQLPDAALARRADADHARPRRGGRGGAGGHRRPGVLERRLATRRAGRRPRAVAVLRDPGRLLGRCCCPVASRWPVDPVRAAAAE